MTPSIANLLEMSNSSTPRNTPVQAYAKLEFGAYSFYVQSLSVTLGRKASETDHVDVHLGNTKAISRQHARVQYNFVKKSFEIYVGGRNGLFVDDIFYEQGSIVTLDDRTNVQIGEIKFKFLLPHQEILAEDQNQEKDSSELSSPLSSPSPSPDPDPDQPAEKPDIPYATLIAQSLLSHPRRRRTLQEIYTWIQDHHAYFKSKNKNWQSSIRHNLLSSPAFVCYGPRQGEDNHGDKKAKRGKDEWGISPEYEGLIGNLSAKEGDTDKLSTKLHKKKAVSQQQTKITPQPKQKQPKPAPPLAPPSTEPQSTPTPAQDKSKLEELMRNIQGKGVDMGALLQEALAKMKGIPLKSSPLPPLKRPKIPEPSISPASPIGQFAQGEVKKIPPISLAVPMPLPYNATKAPIPHIGSPSKKESTYANSPVPSLSPNMAVPPTPAETNNSKPDPAVQPPPPQINTVPITSPKPVETAASHRPVRGKKRGLEV